jgi:hypothetical protein
MAARSVTRLTGRPSHLSRSSIPVLSYGAGKKLFKFHPARRPVAPISQPHGVALVRALSTSRPARYATVDESLDFRDQDRESDEVDVCIVGGGNSPADACINID